MPTPEVSTQLIAFASGARIASGSPQQVIPDLKRFTDRHPDTIVLVLDAVSSRPVDLDLRGSPEAILSQQFGLQESPQDFEGDSSNAEAGTTPRDTSQGPGAGVTDKKAEAETGRATARSDTVGQSGKSRGPGRPRLGVVSREVTLLPRHWEWLASQPGGASVALRKLVEEARRKNRRSDWNRTAQESAYRFMTTLAGNEPGYEEAVRALYAGDLERLRGLLEGWPADVASHAVHLAESALANPADEQA